MLVKDELAYIRRLYSLSLICSLALLFTPLSYVLFLLILSLISLSIILTYIVIHFLIHLPIPSFTHSSSYCLLPSPTFKVVMMLNCYDE